MIKQKSGVPKTHHDKNYSVEVLQNNVISFFNTSEESKYCLCDICLQNYELKQKGQQFLKQSSSMFKIDTVKMKKFFQFLSSVDRNVYFRLQMPDICFFQGGEGKILVKSKLNMVIMIQISPQLRKQIPNFFLQSQKLNNQQSLNFNQHQNQHIKYLDSIIPSVKHGLSNDNPSNLPKNYTFHSDQRNSQDNQIYKFHQTVAREVAIVRYKDKGLQLVNQKQLRQLLKSSKTQSIQLIQTYIRPHQKQAEFVSSEYLHYRKPTNVLMFNRSLIQLKTQIGLISKFSKEYIPMEYLQQYENMLKDIPEEYCLYQTYKMVHYIQINRDIKVKQLNTIWFKDQYGQILFFGVLQFDYEQNEKISAEVTNKLEIKDLAKSQLTELQKELLRTWENMKKKKIKEVRPASSLNDQELKQVEVIKMESRIRSATQNSKRKGSVLLG